MEYAFRLDRIVKNKATKEELDALDPSEKNDMLARAFEKKAHFEYLYHLAETISI